MKTLFLLMGLIFCFCISCENEQLKEDVNVFPYFKTVQDGLFNWTDSTSSAHLYKNNLGIILGARKNASNSASYSGEQLNLMIFLSDLKNPPAISRIYSEWLYVVGGDGISNRYQMDTTANNFVQISSIDTVAKKIYGTFSVRLVRDKFYQSRDTMLFTNGKFGVNFDIRNYTLNYPVIR